MKRLESSKETEAMSEDELVCERCGELIGPLDRIEWWSSSDGKPRHKDGCPADSEDDELRDMGDGARPIGGVH